MYVEVKVTAGPASGKIYQFTEPDCFLFGRAKDARLSLPDDPYISRQHFLLEISHQSCLITDLGSKNGLFVNDVRYGGRRPAAPGVKQAPGGKMNAQLHNGDQIMVGNTIMEIRIAEPQTSPSSISLNAVLDQSASDSIHDAPLIKGYKLAKLIGSGNMGKVYRAFSDTSGEMAAVKIMDSQGVFDEEGVRQFRREVDITRQLKHQHIVELIEYGETEGVFYFVAEFVDGPTLEQFRESYGGQVNLEEAAPIMLGILAGLGYAHRAKIRFKSANGTIQTYTGIVHRDLKPGNILLTRDIVKNRWIPKIADFGLSKSFEAAGLSNMTLPGVVAGTPVYWPREHITYYRYLDPATDVFSIAAVFYELLTGYLVRNGFETLFNKSKQQGRSPGMSDFLRVLMENPTIPIRERLAEIPKEVAAVIDRALKEVELPPDLKQMREKLGDLRYSNATVFYQELLKAFKKVGIPV